MTNKIYFHEMSPDELNEFMKEHILLNHWGEHAFISKDATRRKKIICNIDTGTTTTIDGQQILRRRTLKSVAEFAAWLPEAKKIPIRNYHVFHRISAGGRAYSLVQKFATGEEAEQYIQTHYTAKQMANNTVILEVSDHYVR